MATAVELQTKGRELAAQVEQVMNDGDLTVAEKSTKLDALQKDLEAHEVEVKNSERASTMRAKLQNPSGTIDETVDQVTKAFGGDYASEMLNSDGFAQALKAVAFGAKGQFREQFEVGRPTLKDATAASNLQGEGLMGTTGPTPLGQNPFLTGNAGAGIMPNWLPGIVDQRFYPLTIESLFTSSTTESPSISYLYESLFTNNAAAIAEGGQYPYSTDKWDRSYEQVGKVGNAIKITDETIQDAEQYRAFVQGRLVLGVQRKKESLLLAGAGYPGVKGLLARSASFTPSAAGTTTAANVAFPTAGTAGAGAGSETITTLTYGRAIAGSETGAFPTAAEIAEGIFAAFTDVMWKVFVTPDTILINPLDWQTIRTGKDANGQYYGGSFFGTNFGLGANAGDSLWGKRVIVTPAIPQHTILIGSFASDVANIFRRQGLSVEMTNSNGTDFENGLITVRAEERLALAVYRPAAFQLIQLVAGS